jgi:hypothetical protein
LKSAGVGPFQPPPIANPAGTEQEGRNGAKAKETMAGLVLHTSSSPSFLL